MIEDMLQHTGLRVLVVDDDPKLMAFLLQGLTESGLLPMGASNALIAKKQLAEHGFDLILLDVMMPGGDGSKVLADLRAAGNDIPVIMVTARHTTEDRIEGLQLGADDYVVKPFAFAELLARIDAVMRRRTGAITLGFGPLNISPANRTAHCREVAIELSPKEFDLLAALVRAQGQTLTREHLLGTVWLTQHDPGTNIVDVVVSRLRSKLKKLSGPQIAAVRGQGYRIEA
jgi:DNA-binding response OmpR family regulator